MFDLHLLHLPPLNLLNVNLYYTYTWQERLVRESSQEVCARKDFMSVRREVDRAVKVKGKMEEILKGGGYCGNT